MKVSIIVPTFRRSEYLFDTVRSMLDQSYRDFELLVVDDNGANSEYSPKIRQTLDQLSDSRVHYLGGDRNRGCAGARNVGLSAATGELVAFADDDDLWEPLKLQKQVELMRGRDEVAFVGCGWLRFAGDEILSEQFPTHAGDVHGKLAINHIGPPTTVVFRTDAARESGGFDEDFSIRADIDFYTRVSRLGHFDYVRELLVRYRVHEDNISRKRAEHLDEVDLFLEKHRHYVASFPEARAQLLEMRGDLLVAMRSYRAGRTYASAVRASPSARRAVKTGLALVHPGLVSYFKRSTF